MRAGNFSHALFPSAMTLKASIAKSSLYKGMHLIVSSLLQ
jgi:hypothetical protein